MTWGGDHPSGGDPLGIPGFRGKHKKSGKGKHAKGKGCRSQAAALAALLLAGVSCGLILAGSLIVVLWGG
jgi:hypothetical protein